MRDTSEHVLPHPEKELLHFVLLGLPILSCNYAYKNIANSKIPSQVISIYP